MSKSEYATKYFLEENNIKYDYEHKFDDCVNKQPLKYDFYLPDYNTCIELDGEHHFFPVRFKGIGEELANQRHLYTRNLDDIKNKYCNEQNINLIRIPYWDFGNIPEILSKSLLISS